MTAEVKETAMPFEHLQKLMNIVNISRKVYQDSKEKLPSHKLLKEALGELGFANGLD